MSKESLATHAAITEWRSALPEHPITGQAIVGSTYIEDKLTNDVDVLLLVPTFPIIPWGALTGWAFDGSGCRGDPRFQSLKKELDGVMVNLLVTNNQLFFNNWVKAAQVCFLLHQADSFLEKQDRISIHDIIMGEWERE